MAIEELYEDGNLFKRKIANGLMLPLSFQHSPDILHRILKICYMFIGALRSSSRDCWKRSNEITHVKCHKCIPVLLEKSHWLLC